MEYRDTDFERKYYNYKTMVYRIAYAYMRNVHDTEDIVQKAFLKLYDRRKAFQNNEEEKRWLVRVTINLCKDEKKNFWNKNRRYMDEIEELCYSPTEETEEVLTELGRLPDKYRDCIHLFYIEEYSIEEIAKILRISKSAVKMRLQRGREKLRLEMEDKV